MIRFRDVWELVVIIVATLAVVTNATVLATMKSTDDELTALAKEIDKQWYAVKQMQTRVDGLEAAVFDLQMCERYMGMDYSVLEKEE